MTIGDFLYNNFLKAGLQVSPKLKVPAEQYEVRTGAKPALTYYVVHYRSLNTEHSWMGWYVTTFTQTAGSSRKITKGAIPIELFKLPKNK